MDWASSNCCGPVRAGHSSGGTASLTEWVCCCERGSVPPPTGGPLKTPGAAGFQRMASCYHSPLSTSCQLLGCFTPGHARGSWDSHEESVPQEPGEAARRRPTGNNTDILRCPVFEVGVCLFVPEPMDRLRALNPGISHPSRLSLLTWKWPSTGGLSAGCWPGCRAGNTHSVPLGETLSPALESQHEASNLCIWILPVKLEVSFYRFKEVSFFMFSLQAQ